jgi:hypothetical protein
MNANGKTLILLSAVSREKLSIMAVPDSSVTFPGLVFGPTQPISGVVVATAECHML